MRREKTESVGRVELLPALTVRNAEALSTLAAWSTGGSQVRLLFADEICRSC